MSTNLETLIEKLPPELQDVAPRYASMLGADANKDDLLAIVAYVLKAQFQEAYDVIIRSLTNEELGDIHRAANGRIRERQVTTGYVPGMARLIARLIAEDLVGILVRFGVAALVG